MTLIRFFTLVLLSAALLAHPARAEFPANAESIWDLEALSEAPAYRWIEAEKPIRALLYEGLPYEDRVPEVFAWYASPLTVSKVEEAPAEGFPAVVLIHGGGGTAFAEWVHLWAQRGYAAIAMDLGGKRPADPAYDENGVFLKDIGAHRDNRTPLPTGGIGHGHEEKFHSISRDQQYHWPRHAVANVILAHSLIRSFPEVDAENTAVTGISWGGYTTCIVGSVDHRFNAAVPVYGCGFLYEGESVQLKAIQSLEGEHRQRWIDLYDPSSHLPRAEIPFLFVNGTHDKHYPLDSYARSTALPKGSVQFRLEHRMRHGHGPGWTPEEIGIFIDSHCRSGVPLPMVGEPVKTEKGISLEVNSPTCLKSATLFYTTDEGLRTEREWQHLEASIEGMKVTSPPLPAGTTTWLIKVRDERDAMVSTAPVIVR